MSKLKYDWKYGENDNQNYYEAKVNGSHLVVFANKAYPNVWMGNIDMHMIKKTLLKPGFTTHIFITSDDAKYMMKKVEEFFEKGITDIYQ